MEVSSSNQAFVFLFMVLCGALCTVVFDVFRAVRRFKMSSGRVVALQDLTLWAIEIFIVYMVAFKLNYAMVRAYEIIALFIGGLIYFITASEHVVKILEKLIGFFVNLYNKISVPVLRFLKFMLRPFAKLFCFIKTAIKSYAKLLGSKIRQKRISVCKVFLKSIKRLNPFKRKKEKDKAGKEEALPFEKQKRCPPKNDFF